jgi:hypothetical protein
MYQRTASGRARQLAAIPFELTIHQDVPHSLSPVRENPLVDCGRDSVGSIGNL